MGRHSTIDDTAVFGIIGRTMVQDGAISIQRIIAQTGISSGSLYHRYKSREGLLAHAWLDALSSFQVQFLDVMAAGGANVGEEAAQVTPRFCNQYHDRALILACCQRSQFLGPDTDKTLLEKCDMRNAEMVSLLKGFAQSSNVSLDSCYLGIVQYPLAVVRHYLPARKVPKSAEKHVRAAYQAAMEVEV
ncbi:MAG: TetR/AcrR family transcriptional regulator [Sneathiella sp.]